MTLERIPEPHGGSPAESAGARLGGGHPGPELLAWWADIDVHDSAGAATFLDTIDLDRAIDPTIPTRALLDDTRSHLVGCVRCAALRDAIPDAITALLDDAAPVLLHDPARDRAIAQALAGFEGVPAAQGPAAAPQRRRLLGLFGAGSVSFGRGGLALRPVGAIAAVAAVAALVTGVLALRGVTTQADFDSASATIAAETAAETAEGDRANAEVDAAGGRVGAETAAAAAAGGEPATGDGGTGDAVTREVGNDTSESVTDQPVAAAPEELSAQGSPEAVGGGAVVGEAPTVAADQSRSAVEATPKTSLAPVPPAPPVAPAPTTAAKPVAKAPVAPSPEGRSMAAGPTTTKAAKAGSSPTVAPSPEAAIDRPIATAAPSALSATARGIVAVLGDLGAWSDPDRLAQEARDRVAITATATSPTADAVVAEDRAAGSAGSGAAVTMCALPDDTVAWGTASLGGRRVIVVVRPSPAAAPLDRGATTTRGGTPDAGTSVELLDAASCTAV